MGREEKGYEEVEDFWRAGGVDEGEGVLEEGLEGAAAVLDDGLCDERLGAFGGEGWEGSADFL
jgi:hypothetical protein